MNQVSHLLLVIFAVFAFAACSGTDNLSTNPADIQGEWELTSLNGNQIQASGEEGAYTLSFNADSTIAGQADCNYYTGQYTASEMEDRGTLEFQEVSATKANCSGKSQYKVFVRSIINSETFQVEGGNQLVLSGGDNGKIIFSRIQPVEES